MTAPCGAAITAATAVEAGMAYSAHVSSCTDARCVAASGRKR